MERNWLKLCKAGKNDQAVNELYSPKIVSIEAGSGSPTMPRRMEGIEAIRGKAKWWFENHEIHKGDAAGPWPHDDRFIVRFTYDITPKTGPMKGKRNLVMDEA